jgi:hypothetical protein
MKLDHDILRELLLKVEREQDSPEWEEYIGSKDEYLRFYAVSKLIEGGFLKADSVPGTEPDEEFWRVTEITYDGHEFLETIRDSRIWKATKDAAQKGGATSVEILFNIGKEIAKQQIRQHTGLSL